ncbi:MAG TPA: 1-acyl-sn-glycerol-3-phosphate acyltransferase [Candidatus Omnitrophica bacterium]|nr:1-acyl-sn-glycerol-3-phosphate acyltransferase [Candidatus Omnitrophota bacterium]
MLYWIFKAIFLIILKVFFRLKVEGKENLPKKSNFIVVANHASYLDGLVIMATMPKKISCIAFRGFYKIAWLRWFFKSVEALPSGRSSDKAISLLMQNKNVGLFPEGRLSKDGTLSEFRRGVALLAVKTGRPIVPCAILGTYEALPRRAKLPKFVPITLKIGKPLYLLKEFGDLIDDISLQEGIFKIRKAVKELIDAEG